jgi:hypothetical protein
MKKPWIFTTNPFMSLLSRSRTKALKVSKYSRAQLFSRQADAFFGPLFTYFDPLNQAFIDEQTSWTVQKGSQSGSTSALDILLQTLSADKIDLWDIAVQNVYRKGTPQYKAIFPKGRKPFQNGKKDDRIDAVDALYQALTGIVALATTRTDVHTFYGNLSDARNAQEGAKGDTESDSGDLTAAASAAMVGLYKVLGACINQFPDNPTSIDALFDLQTLRTAAQDDFVLTIDGAATAFIAKRTVAPDDEVRLTVNTPYDVKFFMAEEKNDTNPTVFVIVHGMEEVTVPFSQLGNVPSAKFLKAFNMHDTVAATVEVELL